MNPKAERAFSLLELAISNDYPLSSSFRQALTAGRASAADGTDSP